MDSLIWVIIAINGLVLVGQVSISIIFFYYQWKTGKIIKQAITDIDQRLQDKKLLRDITNRLNKQWANKLSQFKKKMELIKTEAGIEDGGLLSLGFDALTNEEGVIDFALKNKGRLVQGLKNLPKVETADHGQPAAGKSQDPAPAPGGGPPDWADQEDLAEIDKFIEERRKAHG